MPEACFLCLDTTEFMRNGDYFPNRLMSVQEAANILLSAKMQQNQENTTGYLTFGGAACTVMETLTADLDRVLARMTRLPVGGTTPHFSHALLIAALALNHRANPRAEKRIIAFVGSPLTEDAVSLEKLAKKLRKDEVAVDVISIGVDANKPLLEHFIQTISKGGNSRLLAVPIGASVVNSLYTSAILLGNDAVPTGDGEGGGAASGAFQFGIDPNMDPELAMAIRMSLEEERHRAEQAAAAAVGSGAAAPVAAPAPVPLPPAPAAVEERELSEDEQMELALRMSLEPYSAPTAGSSGDAAPAPAPPVNSQQAAFNEAIADEDFLKELQDAINQNAGGPGAGPKDGSDKK
jgi:26S proteasome regulatory subunit N10